MLNTDYKNKAIINTKKDTIAIVQKQSFNFTDYGIIIEANNIAEANELLQIKLKNK